MRATPTAIALIVVVVASSTMQAQTPAPAVLVGGGPTYTYTRPGDRELWGIGARLQGYPSSVLIYRLRVSSQFYRSGSPDPLLFTGGVDVGLTLPRGPQGSDVVPSLTLGAGFFYYATGKDLQTFCTGPGGACSTVNQGYDPGPLLVFTATLGFDFALSPPWRGFADIALHAPSGLGRNGYAGDPHAAFPGLALGLLWPW